MNRKFALIGGDLRIVNLAKMLTEDNNLVYQYDSNCTSLEDTIKNADIVVSSIPFSKNGIDVYAPFNSHPIPIDDLAKCLNNKTFFAGSIPNIFYEITKNHNVQIFDLMEQEDLTILNTIATAEGAISDIILNMPKNIHGSKVLILGFGRVAKTLAIKLKGLDAKITCAARKDKDFAWMETLGFEKTNINKLKENLNEFDVIVNTVPKLILDKEKLKIVKKDCLLIDLASKPGGINEQTCKELNLKFIWALAIPRKSSTINISTIYKKYNI